MGVLPPGPAAAASADAASVQVFNQSNGAAEGDETGWKDSLYRM